jgi:hypothetical protein
MLDDSGRVFVAFLGAVAACAGCGGRVSAQGDSSSNSEAGAASFGNDGTGVGTRATGVETGGAGFDTGGAGFGTGGSSGIGGSVGGTGGTSPVYPSGGAAGLVASASDAGGAPFVVCGAVTCWAPAPSNRFNIPMPPASPCCVDPVVGICGTLALSGSGACTEVPVPDPSCPSAVVPGGVLVGCCTHGNCGLDYSYVGEGCVDDASPNAAIYLQGVPYQHCSSAP